MFAGWYEEFVGSQQYPALEARRELPLVTQLVLTAEGSTTLMLRTLARSEIVAEPLLARSQPIPINDCPELDEVFGNHKALAVRRSRLRNRAGMIVSENLITYRRVDSETLIPLGNTPFGLHVRERGLFERRRIFRTGVTLATFGALPAESAGRVYEISFSTGQSVLVHEVFAPDLLPTRMDIPAPPIVQPDRPETVVEHELVPPARTPAGSAELVVPQEPAVTSTGLIAR